MNPRSTLEIAAIAAERARRGPAIIKTDAHGRELYEPNGPVQTKFLMSDNNLVIIHGPIGSGKTNRMFRRLGVTRWNRQRARVAGCASHGRPSSETQFPS
jgi:hypothetical protein